MESPLEPAGDGVDWDARYRAGDTPWDKGVAHPALAGWLSKQPLHGRILVPGCGLGHDVRAISSSENTVTGLDIAPLAIEQAQKYPKTGNESYILGDLFEPPSGWSGAFAWVFEHTCFCAILPGQRQAYIRQIHRLLKDGGCLLAIFYVDPGTDAGPPFGCSVKELNRLFSPGFEMVETQAGFPTYAGREDREILQVWRKKEGSFPDQL